MALGSHAVSRVDSWPSGNQQVAKTDEENDSRTETSTTIRMLGSIRERSGERLQKSTQQCLL